MTKREKTHCAAVYRVKNSMYESVGGGVVITHNLDRHIKGDIGFIRNPDTGNFIHLGLTKPRGGLYFILIKEEIFPNKPRDFSRRIAYIISDTEALDWIILSGRYEQLNRAKFKPLIELLPGKSIAGIDEWIPTVKRTDALWNQQEIEETERRRKHVPNRTKRKT